MALEPKSLERFLAHLNSQELLLRLTWEEWLSVTHPYQEVNFSTEDVKVRFERNGYEWDMHGSLYTPEKETDPTKVFVMFHGGAGSEKIIDLTPDGWPGLAWVLAGQGAKTLSLTYPGHYPPQKESGRRPYRIACPSIC